MSADEGPTEAAGSPSSVAPAGRGWSKPRFFAVRYAHQACHPQPGQLWARARTDVERGHAQDRPEWGHLGCLAGPERASPRLPRLPDVSDRGWGRS